MEPIPEQYSIIDAFSPNTVENIKKIGLTLYGNYSDLYNQLDYRSVVSGKSTDLSITIDFLDIIVSKGKCNIGGVLIEFFSGATLDVNDENSYIFPELDNVPTYVAGSGVSADKLYVACYYEPSDEDNNAYIGLIRTKSLMDANRNVLCVLGETNVTLNDSRIDYISDDIDYQNRDVIFNVFDGGEE